MPVIASNRINTPELAEQLIADGTADLVSMARPFLADPDFVAEGRRGPRRRDQHVHRVQPGLPRPHVPEPHRLLPGQPPRVPRDHPGPLRDPSHRHGRRRRRRAGRARGGGLGCRARLRCDPLRGGARDRRPVPARDGGAGQGGLHRHAALLHPSARRPRRRRPAVVACRRRRPRVVRRGGDRDRCRAARPGDRRHRPPHGRLVRRRAHRPGRARQAGRRDRGRRDRGRRSALAHPRPGHDHRGLARRTGASVPRRSTLVA